jgi:hypothetical protein
VKSDRYYDGSNCSHNWSNPWYYCYYCGRCHDQNNKDCGRYKEEPEKDRKAKPVRHEEEGAYFRYDGNSRGKWLMPGDRNDEEMDDPWEKEPGEESRHEKYRPGYKPQPYMQTHVHEFEGSTKLAEFDEDVHNHRIAGISGEVIKIPGGHIHKIWTRTDFFDHFHYIQQLTGPAIYVENDKEMDESHCDDPHVHFVTGVTTMNDGHRHEFQLATLIDSPLLPEADIEDGQPE